MSPISKIKEGDIYCNPYTGLSGVQYIVIEVNIPEKLVLVQGYSPAPNCKPVYNSFWKKNSNRMFSPSWKVFNGETQQNC